MDLTQAGAILKAEREKRNLTVEEVAHHLKIGPRQIRALESGETESVVHPAYAKGFIRSYAAWLGLTPEDLQAREQAENGESQAALADAANNGGKKSHAGFLILLLLLIIACFGYYAWKRNFWDFFEKNVEQAEPISSTLPTAEEYLAKKEEPAPDLKRQEETPPAATALAPVDIPEPIQRPGAAAAEPETPAAVQETPTAVQETPAQAEEETITASAGGNHKLIITAIEECWVHSNSDKTDTRQFSLRKGDTFALTFADSLELKLGNAGGVRLRYDGKDMPPPGTSGQVRTIVFPPEE